MIGSTQKFKYKVLAATCARSDCHSRGWGGIRSDVGSKSWYTSEQIGTFVVNSIRFTRRFEGTCHEVSLFTDAVALRHYGNSTVGASCVDLPVAPDCTMCDRNVHDPTTLRDVTRTLFKKIPKHTWQTAYMFDWMFDIVWKIDFGILNKSSAYATSGRSAK